MGLSATLPNYKDVARFLHVNPATGLYHFGPEYRPIPLKQSFLGVTEKSKPKRNDVMNKLAYDKMIEALQNKKQVMIFVHARKETVKTAEAMADLCGKFCTTDLLQNYESETYTLFKRQVYYSIYVYIEYVYILCVYSIRIFVYVPHICMYVCTCMHTYTTTTITITTLPTHTTPMNTIPYSI